MKLIIIDNYDSFTYNLYQMLQALISEKVEVYRNNTLSFEQLQDKRPDKIVLSPGPGHPSNVKDFGVCRDIIIRHEEIGAPTLGVCLGHQGMVQHLGGQVVRAPEVVHGKSSAVTIEKNSPLFDGLPRTFLAMRYHSLVAQEEGFPETLEVLARESKLGLIMALRHKTRPMYGVQFHPESIGTPDGELMLKNFVKNC
jgi:anthranilate synthase/aminodeoxychorismate synthase-like glutamine amidotransferase